jgi:tetratricopeptide (TPR) repeat protein
VYRAAGEYNTALLYAKQLLRLHPHTYHGYCRGAEDLARLGRREQAHTLIQLGLQRFPAEYWVLVVAGALHRQAKRPERSLPLAQRLIATFPEKWEGYEWASADLVALKRFEEALSTVRQGLERAGQRQELVRLEAYARRFVGERASGHSLEGASRTTLSLRDTIAYAHLPGYFGDLQSLRSKRSGPRGEGVGKNVLFVAGLGRSGTSALGQLLNLSAAIELYTELYDPGRLNGYEPEDFQLPRLRAALAVHRQAGDGELLAAKHAGSVWIGDKRPNLQFCLEASYDNFVPGHRLCTIYLQRDLRAVLRSSHRRSENREDLSWSLEHGLEHTVLLHNASCRQLIDLQRRRPEVFASIEFVRYAEVFSDPACSQRLFQQLGVELSPAEQGRLSEFLAASAARTPASFKDGDEPDALGARIEAVIARHLDREAERSLAAISGLPETWP